VAVIWHHLRCRETGCRRLARHAHAGFCRKHYLTGGKPVAGTESEGFPPPPEPAGPAAVLGELAVTADLTITPPGDDDDVKDGADG
jgi:hypothetical protein